MKKTAVVGLSVFSPHLENFDHHHFDGDASQKIREKEVENRHDEVDDDKRVDILPHIVLPALWNLFLFLSLLKAKPKGSLESKSRRSDSTRGCLSVSRYAFRVLEISSNIYKRVCPSVGLPVAFVALSKLGEELLERWFV